jgi:hypothetical protein
VKGESVAVRRSEKGEVPRRKRKKDNGTGSRIRKKEEVP